MSLGVFHLLAKRCLCKANVYQKWKKLLVIFLAEREIMENFINFPKYHQHTVQEGITKILLFYKIIQQ